MKGIDFTGGYGTRFCPAILSLGKRLLPVHKNAIVYYLLATLTPSWIREITSLRPQLGGGRLSAISQPAKASSLTPVDREEENRARPIRGSDRSNRSFFIIARGPILMSARYACEVRSAQPRGCIVPVNASIWSLHDAIARRVISWFSASSHAGTFG